jgi:hypothetical protein
VQQLYVRDCSGGAGGSRKRRSVERLGEARYAHSKGCA